MSILSDFLKRTLSDIGSLLLPAHCPVCGEMLIEEERFVCTACRYRAPMTYFWRDADNPMARRFWGLLPIERASAFIWFIDESRWRDLIHTFKYRGGWLAAQRMGEWYGVEMMRDGALEDIDLIIPVPLHWRKRLARRYNQSEYIASGIARASGIKVETRAVRRTRNNPSQAQRSLNERWDNVEDIFTVIHPERLRSRHILLVDDVFTTGATIASCAERIIEACEGDVRISIAVLAVSRRAMGDF